MKLKRAIQEIENMERAARSTECFAKTMALPGSPLDVQAHDRAQALHVALAVMRRAAAGTGGKK